MSTFSTKLAPRGAYCLGISLGLVIAGFLIRDGVLITLSFTALTIMLACYLIGRKNLSHLQAKITLPNKLHASKNYQPHLSLINDRSLLDAFHVNLTIALPHGTLLESKAGWIAARSASAATTVLNIPMRSTSLQHPYKVSSPFPLSLFQFTRQHHLEHPLTIYPRSITPRELSDHGALGHCSVPLQNATNLDSGEQRGIRPWQPGDPAKNIHWSASARTLSRGDGIRVREFDPPGRLPEQCTIFFHSFSSNREMMREDTFERAISLLVGTINYLRNLNIRVTIISDFLGWHPQPADTRVQYYELLAILADCQRSISTQKHELQQIFDQLPKQTPTIIISDMQLASWQNDIKINNNHLAIDIQQIRFPFKQTISAKEALSKSA